MTASTSTYRRTADYRQLRIRSDATVAELVTAVVSFENLSEDDDITWRVEGETLVLEHALGEQLIPEKEKGAP